MNALILILLGALVLVPGPVSGSSSGTCYPTPCKVLASNYAISRTILCTGCGETFSFTMTNPNASASVTFVVESWADSNGQETCQGSFTLLPNASIDLSCAFPVSLYAGDYFMSVLAFSPQHTWDAYFQGPTYYVQGCICGDGRGPYRI